MKRTTIAQVAACAILLASCAKGGKGQVKIRYLNFKPEVAGVYQELADEYEKQTGVKVIVETAANNAYESTLTSKMATKEAPTLFQINELGGLLRRPFSD